MPLQAADDALKLTPQEKGLYQRHLDNLATGGVPNPAGGGTSTLFSSTFQFDDRFYQIPTVWDGKLLPSDEALKRATDFGLDKFPSYATQEEADTRYGKMHEFMEQDLQQQMQSLRELLMSLGR